MIPARAPRVSTLFVSCGFLLCGLLAGKALAQPTAYGVVTHDLDELRAAKMSELGAGVARISIRWWQVEPSPGDRHWDTLDDYVWNRAAPRGLRLFASLGEPPEWAGGGPNHNRRPADLQQWYDFVFSTVTRYRSAVRYWGIWNEPNLEQFLENRHDYRDIALTAWRAIKDADPSALVLGPEVSEHAFDDGYLAEVMSDFGRDIFDIVTVHVYASNVAEKMDQLVFPWRYGKQVWLTETGRTARPGDGATEDQQRQYYRNGLEAFAPRRWWWTTTLFYDIWSWSWTDRLFGLARPDWTNSPAFDFYREWIATQPAFTATSDTDGDGLTDEWEGRMGLNPRSGAGNDGPSGDPDGDGIPNLQEALAGTHPRGTLVRYLAEGAGSAPFSTHIALLNVGSSAARVLLRFLRADGSVVSRLESVPRGARRTIDAATTLGSQAGAFSTVVESDAAVVVDRMMRWSAGTDGGGHLETSVAAPATQWFLAEGATHSSFQLFYLLANPTSRRATVQVTYLRPAPLPAVVKHYAVAPFSRQNVWVNGEGPELASTDVSAAISADTPIIVERAMYRGEGANAFVAGHESAAMTAAATRWFLAEGATGPYFDLFVLIANATDVPASVTVRYLLPGGTTIVKPFDVGARSRTTLWVDREDARLADTAVSTIVESTNGVPVLVERAMWWPGPSPANWYEAHNSAGAVTTGTKWALAEGEVGGPRSAETFLLVANTDTRSAVVRVTLYFENGTQATKAYSVPATSRFNVDVAEQFPTSAGRRFGAVVESLGPGASPIVVERAHYESGTRRWSAGMNALATKLQ